MQKSQMFQYRLKARIINAALYLLTDIVLPELKCLLYTMEVQCKIIVVVRSSVGMRMKVCDIYKNGDSNIGTNATRIWIPPRTVNILKF